MPAMREITGARAWMDQYAAAGIEGLVVKDRRRGYRHDRGRAAWQKVGAHHSAEAVVGGVIGHGKPPRRCYWAATTSTAGSAWSAVPGR
jgi:ATP-dependent DNA ligase